jgi:hypothetical protein
MNLGSNGPGQCDAMQVLYLCSLSEDQVFYLILTENAFETIGMISLFAFFEFLKNLETKWMNLYFRLARVQARERNQINKANPYQS